MQSDFKTGTVSVHPKGFGFVQTSDAQRFFMRPALLRKLMSLDEINFTVIAGREPQSLQVGEVELVRRPAGAILGTLTAEGPSYLLEPDDPCFVQLRATPGLQPVPDTRTVVLARTSALAGPLALSALPSYATVTVVRELGRRKDPGFDQAYALARHGFEAEFSPQALIECAQVTAKGAPSLAGTTGRADLQELAFVTVDSATTQDFDDAIYAERIDSGWRVMVAIADVSHYVKAGGALDACAQARGTSVYLPGQTVPMLPRELSAGLCALKEKTSRLAVVVELLLDANAQLTSSRVHRAIIKVARNLTYDYVLQCLDPSHVGALPAPAVLLNLQALNTVYLRRIPYSPVGLSCGPEEPEPVWTPGPGQGTITWVHRHDAHKLVECFMLLANREVAKQLSRQAPVNLFRHQGLPDALRWDSLATWARDRGYSLPSLPCRAALTEFLAKVDEPEHLEAQLALRSTMASASYDSLKTSHFSLGYDDYTHFTSPIRRYADLLVHRLLLGDGPPSQALPELAAQCSDRSRGAKHAERYVWDKLKKRALLAEATPALKLLAYVVGQSRFGLRAVVQPWQCVCDVAASDLRANGLTFDDARQTWRAPGHSLTPGSYLMLQSFTVDEFKAKTDVHAKLSSVLGHVAGTAAVAVIG